MSTVESGKWYLMKMIETKIAFFHRKDYQSIKRMFPNHPNFPDAYDEWFYLARKHFLEEQSHCHSVQEVIIDPSDFAKFCDRTGRKYDLAALNAFIEEIPRQIDNATPLFLRNQGGGADSGG
jgi:hypothetical protein